MSEKKVKAVQIPKVWENLTPPDKGVASRCVVITLDNKIIVLPNHEELKKHPEISISNSWENMEDYLKKTNKQAKLAFHEQYIGEVPKDQDETAIGFMTWAHFVKNGIAIITGHDASGNKERKSSLGTRVYTLLEDPGTGLKTPQAQACMKIFKESVIQDGDKKNTITEEELKRAVIARGQELKTRQDPWRIFQYYRPDLIKGKFIKHD
jgi:hypothetical protein